MMFNKLLNEKNKYILLNLIFLLCGLTLILLIIALLKDTAINVINGLLTSFNSSFFTVLFIFITIIYIGYIIYKLINHQVIIKVSIVYITLIASLFQLFSLDVIKYYFSRMTVENVLFFKKFMFIICYFIFAGCFIYSLSVVIKTFWRFIKKKIINYAPPKINSTELKQVIGIHYLDFEYDPNLSYYVTYESNGKIIKEDLTNNKLLCLMGELIPNEEYTLKLYSLGKLKARFIALEASESIKFTLKRKPTELQERIAYYYHYSPILIECYISLFQIFDKMFKRLLNYSPEVVIIDSITNKTVFAKIHLDKENIVLRFSANPYLLDGYNITNSFEEDCMCPTKYIIRSLDDVEYVKKIVDKIKSMKK